MTELKSGTMLQSAVDHAVRYELCNKVGENYWGVNKFRLVDGKWKFETSVFAEIDPKDADVFWKVVEE